MGRHVQEDVALTGDIDMNYNQLLRSAIQNGTVANLPATGNEVSGQQYLATDICTLYVYCDGAWKPVQSFDAVYPDNKEIRIRLKEYNNRFNSIGQTKFYILNDELYERLDFEEEIIEGS